MAIVPYTFDSRTCEGEGTPLAPDKADGSYCHTTHGKQLAFRCTIDAAYDNVWLEIPNTANEPVRLEEVRPGYWIEPYADEDESNSYTAAGVFRVVARAGARKVDESGIIYVLPSNITKEDYLSMLRDLLDTHQWLVEQTSTVGIANVQRPTFEKDPEALVTELVALLKKMRARPRTSLAKSYAKVPRARVRRFDSAVMKSLMKSGNTMGVAAMYTESPDIYENRAIKATLERIKKRLEDMKSTLKARIEHAQKSAENALRANADPDDDTAEQYDSTPLETLNKRYGSCQKALQLVTAELDLPWYRHIATLSERALPRPTQIFTRDVRYNAVYKMLARILEQDVWFDPSFDTTAFGVRRTWQVYEHWCFVKIFQRLIDLGFSFEGASKANAIELFRQSLAQQLDRAPIGATLKEDFAFDLVKDIVGTKPRKNSEGNWEDASIQDTLKLRFIYQGRLLVKDLEDKPDSRPDFMFILQYSQPKPRTYVIVADSKYKSFDAQSLKQEIKSVAIAKYIYRADIEQMLKLQELENCEPATLAGSFILQANDIPHEYGPAYWVFGGDDQRTEPEKHRIGNGVEIDSRIALDFDIEETDTQKLSLSSDTEPHPFRYGAITLLPSTLDTAEDGLELLFKLMFQYYDYYYAQMKSTVCWHCGESADVTAEQVDINGFTATHYICNNCKDGDAFLSKWAYSYCSKNAGGCNHQSIVNNRGVHYGIRTAAGQWYMRCPICGNQFESQQQSKVYGTID